MPTTIETTVYTFDELSDRAKEKARDWFRQGVGMFEWWQSTYDDAENIGLKIKGFDIDRGSYCEGEFTLPAIDVALRIRAKHGEACETCKTAEAFIATHGEYHGVNGKITLALNENADISELEGEFEEKEEEFRKALLEDYLSMLRQEFEFQTSEECVDEGILANEYTFTEYGKRFG